MPNTVPTAQVRRLVERMFERREYNTCWFDHDDYGDCGNLPNCHPGCPLRQLATLAGLKPQDDGGTDKQ